MDESPRSKAQRIDERQESGSRIAERQRQTRSNAQENSLADPTALYATAPVGLCLLDTDLRFVHINEWLANINGPSVEEHLGRKLSEVLPDVAARVEPQLRQVIETGEPMLAGSVEAGTQAHPGLKRYVEYNFQVVKSQDGSVTGVSCTVLDITERKQAEKALHHSKSLYQSLVEHLPQMIFRKDLDGRVTFANQNLCESLGLPLDEVLGRTDFELYSKTLAEKYRADDLRVIETGELFDAVEDHRTRDGQLKYVRVVKSPIRDADQQIVGIQGIFWDITERRQSRLALQESEERLAGEKRILELVATGTSLKQVLTAQMEFVESLADGMFCSVLLLDQDGTRLRHGAAPSLPEEYIRAIDGIEIGPDAGSCGTAAYLDQPVIVENIATDPLWADFRDLAMQHGLRACWSTPIHSSTGKVLGTFAMYYCEPRSPDSNHRRLIERTVHLAAIAIDLRQADQTLRESEEKHRTLIESSPFCIHQIDCNGRLMSMNRAGLQMIGEENESAVIGVPYLSAVCNEDRERISRLMDAAFTGEPSEFEFRGTAGLEFSSNFVPVFDVDGKVDRLLGITQDITQRKQAEDALRHSEALMSKAQEIAHIASFEWDVTRDRIDWSDEMYRIYGMSRDDFGGTIGEVMPLIHPDDRGLIQDGIEQALKEGTHSGYALEYRIIRPDGTIRTVFAEAELVGGTENASPKFIGFVQDITERKRAEAVLRESETRSRSLLEGSPVCTKIIDLDSRLQYMSAAGISRLKISDVNPLYGCTYPPEFYPESMRVPLANSLEQAIAGEISSLECLVLDTEGSEVWYHTTFVPASDDEGQVVYVIATSVDITERKRAEEALREMNVSLESRIAERTAELQSSNAELEAFAYSVAHDLRAPLRGMQGFASALLDDYADQLDVGGREFAGKIVDAAERMDGLILDQLTYSRIGRSEVQLTTVNLSDVVRDCLTELDAEIRQRDVQITIDQPLPILRSHRRTLIQIIENLLTNGMKFVAKGIRPHIHIWVESHDDRIVLWVEDNGIGIPTESEKRVFRVFERLHGMESYPGTGIGLAIVRRAAESLEGSVGLESSSGKGSRFWVELPVRT